MGYWVEIEDGISSFGLLFFKEKCKITGTLPYVISPMSYRNKQ